MIVVSCYTFNATCLLASIVFEGMTEIMTICTCMTYTTWIVVIPLLINIATYFVLNLIKLAVVMGLLHFFEA
jgi:Na+-driven multidrug efflux pump